MKFIYLFNSLDKGIKKKWRRIMRLTFLLTVGFIFTVNANSYSQNTRLDITLKNGTILELMEMVEKQSEFVFLYKDEDLNLQNRLTVNMKEATIEQVLAEGFKEQNVAWDVYDRQIVLRKAITPASLDVKTIQQQRTVTGVVTDQKGLPLPGVSIIVKGTTTGTVTDSDGKFFLAIPVDTDVLQFSFLGMKAQEITIEGRSAVTVIMEEESIGIEEVVAIGYGSIRKREMTGAVVSVKGEDITKMATSDFASAIQGQMAGVSVKQGNAAPGENAQITIRGQTSFQAGGSEPLFIVDGVTYDTNPNISPQEIESIQVLKDGASAAIYGSRASGGVILITTKRGREGIMKVNLDSYYGVQDISSSIPVAGTLDALYINDLVWRFQSGVNDPLQVNRDGLQFNTDWFNELQVDIAPIQNHSLNVSGGRSGLTYNIIGTYFNQKGSLINSGYEKVSLRNNTSYQKRKLKIDTHLNLSFSDQMQEPFGLMYDAVRNFPYIAPADPDSDTFSFEVEGNTTEHVSNFAGKLKQENNRGENSFNGNIQLDYEIIKGLNLRANLGRSFTSSENRRFIPSYTVYTQKGEINTTASNMNAQLRLTNNTNIRNIAEFLINFKKNYRKHNFNLILGNTYESSVYNSYSTGADYISNNKTPILSNGDPIYGSQYINRRKMVSYLGRLLYNYRSRYMVSALTRVDGSSNFGPLNRYGLFPSLSAAWLVSEENFFEGIKGLISLAKIRFGYGNTGSDRIPPYSYSPVVISNTDYIFGIEDDLTKGMTQPGFADPNLKWETNISKSLGFDFEFNRGKAGLEMDIYEQKKNNMLLHIISPISAGATPISGYERYLTNIGNLQNRGLEINSYYNFQLKSLRIKLGGTFTKNDNKVIKLSREDEIIYDGYPNIVRRSQTEPVAALKAGLPIGAFLVYETNGTIKTDEDLLEYLKLDSNAQKGDLKYVDSDGDGIISIKDRVYKGSYQPDFEYGFNVTADYKKIDFTIQFYGVYGSTIYNGLKQYAYSMRRHQDLVYAWSKANPTSDIPTPRTNNEHPNVRTSTDMFLEDGSFFRIRNIILGYSFNKSILNKYGIDNFRVYVSAQNPVTWTKYTGYDPEVGSDSPHDGGLDRGDYPVSAIYRTGILIEF